VTDGDPPLPVSGPGAETLEPTAAVTVAIVDAHSVFCESLVAHLWDQPGLRVVSSSAQATGVVEMVLSTRPDVLVIDEGGARAVLPLANGATAGPAVVLMMSGIDHAMSEWAVRRGVDGIVLKESSLHDLLDAIYWVAEGKKWIAPPLLSALLVHYEGDQGPRRDRRRIARLTQREEEILALMVDGSTQREIAQQLHLSVNTVRTHSHNLQKKLNVHSALAAVSAALQEGFRPSPEAGAIGTGVRERAVRPVSGIPRRR
jgi:DNA-binding NarL/FixJ family response regulator